MNGYLALSEDDFNLARTGTYSPALKRSIIEPFAALVALEIVVPPVW